MKRKLIAAIGIAGMMASIAACGGSDDEASKQDPKDRKGELTVWLMVDAQSSWPELVKQANTEFNKKYPGVKVNVQYQQWGDKTKKLDAALSGDSFPDVVELGNTETMTYILNGALGEIDAKKYDNSDTWIEGLKDTCSYEGKLYCVPYYAGARVAIYNKDMFKAGTGSDQLPKTEDELLKALDKVQDKYKKDNAFSALYLPGRYWYAAMSYVAAYGGEIATYDEGSKEWKAALSTPEAQKGIQHFIDLVKKYNHGDQTKDEQDHANVMANEKTALLYGNAWEAGSVVDSKTNGNPKLKDKIATAGMPGPEGKALPSFIGGSDLATVSKSDQQDLGQEWISLFTNEKSQAALAEKNILPNNTKQLEPLKAKPETAPIANAVPDAWFTPIAPGWSAIEKKETLETMLLDILKGKSVAEATKAADAEINSLINEAS
ncbi:MULTISPECIES: sugar ABC transporter substrate-binding protein [Streptomyces]|uniref:Sugar ABC transporter substrate-binding protein n=1 Tax=Streptomyces salinarius TaxID=2762598 RepID=A0ABW8B4Y0_9ACTN|nr:MULTISPECIES: sugar ABC transporter substrate-binding protein [Streptomyces]WSU01398.1 sugar ABC transporter substrate-binding protein [Streptomyces sp. NBC_01124]MCQ4199978.1 sugar ABC transporter substrate-binding protein [Streptomyces coelicoflavus]MCV2458806.1 sugar ABC transporter substrate-binding protein [Streptomyces sp. ICN988]MDU0256154.1 sugar ABC transporter substrate-binding protein [Streptomyces sp. PU10]QKW61201.1 extracellular solute-binding protein [Streptomyces sp. NA03103